MFHQPFAWNCRTLTECPKWKKKIPHQISSVVSMHAIIRLLSKCFKKSKCEYFYYFRKKILAFCNSWNYKLKRFISLGIREITIMIQAHRLNNLIRFWPFQDILVICIIRFSIVFAEVVLPNFIFFEWAHVRQLPH